MSLEPAVQLQVAAAPSSKALGKRRLDVDQPASSAAAAAPPPPPPRQPTLRERRVTRSSRGQQATAEPSSPGNSTDGQGHAQPRYLPARTSIRLVSKQPRTLVPYQTIAQSSSSTTTAATLTSSSSSSATSNHEEASTEIVKAEEKQAAAPAEKPLFRLLDETELLPPRGTRHAAAEIDTSDAFYHRLHRYPEVLEKRAARLERERLIHERSKLINELEELRGRTWVYAGTSAGGRAEAERQRRIKAMGEKLARYDALLPNQPRKSNFLNLAGAGAVPGPSNPAAAANAVGGRDTRTVSPALHAPVPSRPRPSSTTSGSHAAASRPAEPNPPHARPSTPVSAASVPDSNGNKTTIRIKFGPPPTTTITTNNHSSNSSAARRDDGTKSTEYDLDRYTVKGELRKGPKRDRKAERERAEERRKLGLKPRSSIDKATAQLPAIKAAVETTTTTATGSTTLPPNRRSPAKRVRRSSRAGVSYAETDDDEDDDDDDELDDDEDATMANGTRDSANARQGTSNPNNAAAASSSASSSRAKLVRKRLPDSFFHSAALRDAVMASHQHQHQHGPGPGSGPNGSSTTTTTGAAAAPRRRASSRVSYAFGQRLPEQALVRQVEFEPHGGVSNDAWDDEEVEGHSRTTLEEMVRLRMERLGEEAVVLGGHVLPKSAVDAWSKDPLHVSPLTAYQALQPNASEAPSTTAEEGPSSHAAVTPLPEPVAADTTTPLRAVSPELAVDPSPHSALSNAAWATPKPVAS